jgi:Uma2 family endonuclease
MEGTIAMIDMLVAPEKESFPNRRRWTVEQCYRLVDKGELPGRWELIDGEILSKMGQKPPHSFTLVLFAEWLTSLFGFRRTRTQLPIIIRGRGGDLNEPEPDIAIVTVQASGYHDRVPEASDVLLIVEIADSSLLFDLTTKALLYARCGVAEYWVVDVANRQVYQHRSPDGSGYTEVVVLAETDIISPEVSASSAALVCQLLPPQLAG